MPRQLVITIDLDDSETFEFGGALNLAAVADYVHYVGEEIEEHRLLTGALNAQRGAIRKPRGATGPQVGTFAVTGV